MAVRQGAAVVRAVVRRVGRRGASLLFVGMLAFVLAASLVWLSSAQAASTPAYLVLSEFAPLRVWAAAWAVSGALCWVQAFMRSDRLAFAVATAMWWTFGLAYLVGVVTGVNPRGWVGGGIWLAFGGWLNLIATWPEAARPDDGRG